MRHERLYIWRVDNQGAVEVGAASEERGIAAFGELFDFPPLSFRCRTHSRCICDRSCDDFSDLANACPCCVR